MEIKDLSKYSNAEKIILAEQLWDSVSKKDIELSKEIQKELDYRLQLLEEGKSELYSMEEVKKQINKIRNQ
ncbi:addiction module protein [Flavobacterium sp.]|jgi:putative addiction module component (TIGR02574 family)|uniref:addiction module protein n=1 Tax=Flavobacterium sp. TaxID=239 RepID=UPI0037BFB6F9